MFKWRYLYSLCWSIGAIILIYYSSFLFEFASDWKAKTYTLKGYSLWIPIWISIIMGIYLAFINGIPKQFRISPARLVIFAISFILLAYFVSFFYTNLVLLDPLVVGRLMGYHGQFFVGIICGYSILTGLFIVKDGS